MTQGRPDDFRPPAEPAAPAALPDAAARIPTGPGPGAGAVGAAPAASGPGGAGTSPTAPAASGPGAATRPFSGRGTLSRQLVLRVTLLVAGVAVTLSALTGLAAFTILQGQLDQTLVSRATGETDRHGPIPDGTNTTPSRGPGDSGQQVGMLQYYSVTNYGRILTGNDPEHLTAAENDTLNRLPVSEAPRTVVLPEHGMFRVLVRPLNALDISTGRSVVGTEVVGLPMDQVFRPLSALVLAAAALTAAAIGLAFLLARSVVHHSLQPLARLASTAHQVSQLELDSGEVAVPVRVPAADTDPRSEVGQVGLAFNRMLDNVESALDARQRSETKVRQFVADASHELRNPLASIRGYAELTRRERADTPENTAHALTRIESESVRMSALVEDLLLLARLDAGPSLAMRPVPLSELVANAVSDAQAAGPDHEWELNLPAVDVVAVGDPSRLLQVVANLLANARTHTPPGTLVRTSLAAEDGLAVVRVADNGPGIPESIRDKVFERFTRADAARVRAGGVQSTGLGLAIVSAVLQAHRGSASVESSPAGSTFVLRLPLATP